MKNKKDLLISVLKCRKLSMTNVSGKTKILKAGFTIRDFFSDFIQFIKNIFLLFRINSKEIIIFITLCNLFSILSAYVLKSAILNLLMLVSGTTYIAPVNLTKVFLNPVSILVIIMFAVIIMMIDLFEIAGLLHVFSMSQVGRSTNLISMFLAGFRTCCKALHPKNWLIMAFVIVALPLTKLLPLSSTTYKLVLPGFVNQTINYTQSLKIVNNICYFLTLCFVSVYLFAINSFVLQKKSFFASCRQSRKLEKGNYVKTVLSMALLTVLLNFLINSVASAITLNSQEIMSFFKGDYGVVSKSEGIGMSAYVIRQILKSFISTAINNAALTVLFYKYIEEQEMLATISADTFVEKKVTKRTAILVWTVVAVFFAGTIGLLIQKYSFLKEDVSPVLVCAHRGDNVNAPENTMPAFMLAGSENLEWIELDVHQTSDGVIVCNHDSGIGRVTGTNLAIHDTAFEELTRYEMGDWMPGNYEGVVVPSLEEVLTYAKENGIHVQVELKGNPGDVAFEENVINVINKTGMHDNVMIIAQDASRLERVYEIDPTITKGYCIFVGYGDLGDIYYTDNISIEESNITPELVRNLHEKGIKVFCWTVDLDDTVQYLVSCDVDVIGTDNPNLISAAAVKADYSGGISRVFHIVMHTIAGMDK